MKKLRVLQTALLCVAVMGVCLTSFGCADDNEQIRSVINKFYHQEWKTGYFEGHNSKLVTKAYDHDLEYALHGLLTYIKTDDARQIDIRFSEIDIREDFATARYSLYVTDRDGEEWAAGYTTNLVREDGRWKLSFTSSSY